MHQPHPQPQSQPQQQFQPSAPLAAGPAKPRKKGDNKKP